MSWLSHVLDLKCEAFEQTERLKTEIGLAKKLKLLDLSPFQKEVITYYHFMARNSFLSLVEFKLQFFKHYLNVIFKANDVPGL